MADKSVGSVEDMLGNAQLDIANIAQIKITIVYELYFYASWFDWHRTNWRCDYTLMFG